MLTVKKNLKNSIPKVFIFLLLGIVFISTSCSDKVTDPDYPPPVASFSCNPISGEEPLTVHFNNNSSGEITSYRWDFGDNRTSSGRSPSHTYTSGTYRASLTVSGPGGTDTKIMCNYITVTPQQSIYFTDSRVDIGNQGVTMYADLEIHGYSGSTFAVGGYWFRYSPNDNSYYYVEADCTTNVPRNYLGHQWTITVNSNYYSNEIGFYTPYDCFPERTGSYYGKIKIYKASTIPICPNYPTHASTGYVRIYWTLLSSNNPDNEPQLSFRILSESESDELERAIEAAGGVQSHPDNNSISANN